LPADVQATLAAHEAAGTTDSAEYEAAAQVYYRRYVCRLVPWPDPLQRAVAGLGRPVYRAMWGPAEFYLTGTLKEYDRTPRLGELAGIPTLFTCGELDEATPGATAWYRSLVPGAEMVVFSGCSHMPHLEDPVAYLSVVSAFLLARD
jgi:proline iminopeptidase